MLKKINEIYKGVIGSLNNVKDDGFSARKLTALAVIVMLFLLHIRNVNDTVVTTVIMYDEIFIAFLLGMITTEQVIRFKNGENKVDETKKEEETPLS